MTCRQTCRKERRILLRYGPREYSVATSSSTRLLHDPEGEGLKRYAMRYSSSLVLFDFLFAEVWVQVGFSKLLSALSSGLQ